MFLHYQPHLYEREKRREREQQNSRSPQMTNDGSSIDSSSISNDSLSISSNQNHFFERRSSFTMNNNATQTNNKRVSSSSSSVASITASAKNDHSSSSSHSGHSGHSGLFNKFHLRRNKSNGHEKSSNVTTHHATESKQHLLPPDTTYSRVDLTNSPRTYSPESSRGRDSIMYKSDEQQHSPLQRPRQSQSLSPSASQIQVIRKPQRQKRIQRPSTANESNPSSSLKKQFFHLQSASRSEQDLQNLSMNEREYKTFDDEDSQEILTADEPSYDSSMKDKLRAGLRISISYDSNYSGGLDGNDNSSIDLTEYPLPVRLGLIPVSLYNKQQNPDLLPVSARSSMDLWNSVEIKSASSTNSPSSVWSHQYVDGYYLCTPPPLREIRRNGSPSPNIYRNNLVPMSPMSRLSDSAEEKERWRLCDYFEVQRTRRPGRFGVRERKRHGYPVEEAPYPLGYGNDTNMAENLVRMATDQSITTPLESFEDGAPKRVLDIGCGLGQWVLQNSKKWKETEFIGLDLVPIQTPLKQCSSDDGEDLSKRISWVVANVLKGLPFPKESFDLVRIRYLNLGIPKNKWQPLLEEVNRVLTPGGQFLITETDFSFLGRIKHIPTNELMNLIMGDKHPIDGEENYRQQYKSKKVSYSKNKENRFQRNTALNSIWQKILERRGIGLNPSTFIPELLKSMKDASHIGQSDPRHIPILEYSHRKTFAKRSKAGQNGEYSENLNQEKESGLTDEKLFSKDLLQTNHVEGYHAFSNDPQSGSSLPNFRVQVEDLDVLRMVMMTADTLRLSDARDTFWQEINLLRNEMIENGSDFNFSKNQEDDHSNPSMFSSCLTEAEMVIALRDAVKRWPDYSQFEYELDQWQAEMHARADAEEILKRHMYWCEAAERFDGWTATERERKIRKRQQLSYFSANQNDPLQNSLFFQGTKNCKESNKSPEMEKESTESINESSLDNSFIDVSDWIDLQPEEDQKTPSPKMSEIVEKPCSDNNLENSVFLASPSRFSTGIFAEYEAFNISSKMFRYPSEESLLNDQKSTQQKQSVSSSPKDQISVLGYRSVILAHMRKKDK